jgi:hypothetical protein
MTFRIRNTKYTIHRKVSKPRSANYKNKKSKSNSRKHSANNVTGKPRQTTKDHPENVRLVFIHFFQKFEYEKQHYYFNVESTLNQLCQMCINTPEVCKRMGVEDIKNLKTTRGVGDDEYGNLVIDSVFKALDTSDFKKESTLIQDNFSMQLTVVDITMKNIIEMVKTVPMIYNLTEDDFMACIPKYFEEWTDKGDVEFIEISPDESTIARNMAHNVYYYMGIKDINVDNILLIPIGSMILDISGKSLGISLTKVLGRHVGHYNNGRPFFNNNMGLYVLIKNSKINGGIPTKLYLNTETEMFFIPPRIKKIHKKKK